MRTNKVWTPNGYQAGPVNSLVGKGESIIDYTNGTGTLVTKGKVGVDNQPSSVQADDQNVIAGNDIDWSTGKKFSDQVAPLTAKLQMYNNIENKTKENKLSSLSKQTVELQNAQLQRAKAPILDAMKNITDRQQKQHQIEDYAAQVKANRGIDCFDNGKSSSSSSSSRSTRTITTTTSRGKVPTSWLNYGALSGFIPEYQMLQHWLKEQPQMPNIYAANRYAPAALQTLNKLRVDPYNQLQALNKAEREAYYRMQQAGGYTGGQRQNARVALALGNARNAADIYNNTQLQNDKYRQQWATAALAEGNQDAARRQAAAQYGWEAYNKAHGAKTKGIETHLAALGQKAQKYWADRIKNRQYEDTLSIYQDDVNNRKDALNAIYGGASGSNAVSTNPGQYKFNVEKIGSKPLGYTSPFATTSAGTPSSVLSPTTSPNNTPVTTTTPNGNATPNGNNNTTPASDTNAPYSTSGYNYSQNPWLTNYMSHADFYNDPLYLTRPNDMFLGNLGPNNTIQYGYPRNGEYPNPFGINYQAMNGPRYFGDMRYINNYQNGGFRSNAQWLNDQSNGIGKYNSWIGGFVTDGYRRLMLDANMNNHVLYGGRRQ